MTCRLCLSEFETPDRGVVTVAYCSPECRKEYRKRASRKNYHTRTPRVTYTCRHCGSVYAPKTVNRNQFCGRECARLAQGFDLSKSSVQRPHCKVYYPNCEQCGKAFVSNTKTVRLCSEACKEARREEACLYPRTCKVCSSLFTRKWAHDVCSKACQRVLAKPHRVASRKKRRALGLDDHGKAHKRAKRCGVAYEPIRRRKVYERDGWMCLLCRRPIKQGVVVPHPLSATLDHIIPMAKGGSHTYANVQTAHFRCNWMKGDKAQDEQLLLVG